MALAARWSARSAEAPTSTGPTLTEGRERVQAVGTLEEGRRTWEGDEVDQGEDRGVDNESQPGRRRFRVEQMCLSEVRERDPAREERHTMFAGQVPEVRLADGRKEVSRRGELMPADEHHQHSSRSQRLCVTSTGSSAGDAVDPRFGRCAYFMVSSGPETEFRPVENTARGLGNGAGIQAAQTIANMGVEVVLTGDLGPNAFRVLRAAGIRAFRANGGTVEQAVSEFHNGMLSEIHGPTARGHQGGRGHGPRWQEQRWHR